MIWTELPARLHRRLFLYTGGAAVALTVLLVPQVNHLFMLPIGWRQSTLAYVFLVAVLAAYGVLVWWTIPHTAGGSGPPVALASTRLGHYLEWPIRRAQKAPRKNINILAVSLALAATAWYVLPLTMQWDEAWRYFGQRPVRFSAALLIGGLALLLVGRRWMSPYTWNMFARFLVALLIMNAVGECIWWVSDGVQWVPLGCYTIWALCHLAFIIIVTGAICDAWQAHTRYPVRLVAAIVALLVFAASGPVMVGALEQLRGGADPPPASSNEAWLENVEQRLSAMPQDGPVVLVAASGGGSRAALFTSLALQAMAQTPLTIDGGSYKLYDRVLFISAVSGGALASAEFVANGPNLAATALAEPTDLAHYAQEQAKQTLEATLDLKEKENGSGPEWDRRIATDQAVLKDAQAWAASVASTGPNQPKAGGPGPLPWLLHSRSVDRMRTDFMAPLLRGALHPGFERGESVSRFWAERFDLDRRVDDPAEPSRPLVLLNTCSIPRGHVVTMGCPPLPANFYTLESDKALSVDGAVLISGVTNADLWGEVIDVSQPPCRLSLAEAVRLSANFPWGFAVANVPTAPDADVVRFTDGGVFDVTGMHALRRALEYIARRARTDVRARRILDALRRRGVILVEIDSGAKPQPAGRVARFFAAMLEPAQGLSNASYVNSRLALLAHQADMTRLMRFVPGEAPMPPAEAAADVTAAAASWPGFIKPIVLQCNGRDNVMTAWALSTRDQAQIIVRFMAGWTRAQEDLAVVLAEHKKWSEWVAFNVPAREMFAQRNDWRMVAVLDRDARDVARQLGERQHVAMQKAAFHRGLDQGVKVAASVDELEAFAPPQRHIQFTAESDAFAKKYLLPLEAPSPSLDAASIESRIPASPPLVAPPRRQRAAP